MLRTLAGRILGLLALVVVLCPVLPVRPPEAAAVPAGATVFAGGGAAVDRPRPDFAVPRPAGAASGPTPAPTATPGRTPEPTPGSELPPAAPPVTPLTPTAIFERPEVLGDRQV
jgi:hypothetical protein